jgi:hypothetical protein
MPNNTTRRQSSSHNSMKPIRSFHHVTAVKNVDAILKHGLRGGVSPRNRGEKLLTPSIFVLIYGFQALTDNIAINQLWIDKDIKQYAVIRIRAKGVTGRVLDDNVAEASAPLHRIIEQDVIEPQFISVAKIRELNFPGRRLMRIQSNLLRRRWNKSEWELANKWYEPAIREVQSLLEAGEIAGRN